MAPSPAPASKTFISYARVDSEFAVQLAKDLRAGGASVWMDQLDIAVGTRWDRTVQEALEACPRLLVILTPGSVSSDNVMDEVSYALDSGKVVIPVLYQDCEIPLRLRRLQRLDVRDGLSDLMRLLGIEPALPANPMSSIQSTEPPPLPVAPLVRRGIVSHLMRHPRQLAMVAGSFIGLVYGIVIVWISALADSRFAQYVNQHPEEAAVILAICIVLGVIIGSICANDRMVIAGTLAGVAVGIGLFFFLGVDVVSALLWGSTTGGPIGAVVSRVIRAVRHELRARQNEAK